jgi:hypothetical protein
MLGAAIAITRPGAKKSRHATVCKRDEVSLYALRSRTVFVIYFPTENRSEINGT